MSRRHSFLILILLSSIALGAATLEAERLPAGQVVERVVCRSDPGQSYALYLPTGYTPERRWPVLLCFEPGGRGPLPVKLFQPAAENYGWIVACSNNARNGPWNLIEPAMQALWDDTRERLAIDGRRMYAAGFSGGARVAYELASRHPDDVAGVILCGAGLPRERLLPQRLPFAIFGTAGRKDFNYLEVKRLDDMMAGREIVHRLAIFEGGHEWLPADVAARALGWFEVVAMRQGRRPADPALVAALLADGLAEAEAAESNGRLAEALRLYDSLARDFAGLAETASAEAARDRLRNASGVKKALKEEARREKAEADYQIRGSKMWEKVLSGTGDVPDAAEVAEDLKIAELLAAAKKLRGTPEGYQAARQVNWVLMEAYSEAPEWRRRGDRVREIFCWRLVAAILPDRPEGHYNLAAALAAAGEIGEAFTVLRTAVDKGFADAARLEADPDFAALRPNPAFQSLLTTLREKR